METTIGQTSCSLERDKAVPEHDCDGVTEDVFAASQTVTRGPGERATTAVSQVVAVAVHPPRGDRWLHERPRGRRPAHGAAPVRGSRLAGC
jgi:hypothetical protein